MRDQPPYVEAKEHIRAQARVRGHQYDLVVIGWRGDRVDYTWRSDMGEHLGWLAEDVERVSPLPLRCGEHLLGPVEREAAPLLT